MCAVCGGIVPVKCGRGHTGGEKKISAFKNKVGHLRDWTHNFIQIEHVNWMWYDRGYNVDLL